MTLPNLFVIGAPRCGTTSVHELLGEHPEIFMSKNKEPWFYAFDDGSKPFTGPGDGQGIRDRQTYLELFHESGDRTVVGEASTLYLASTRAPQAIKLDVPNAHIVAILRNPIDRAFSNYTQHRWQGREKLSFEAALTQGPSRVADGWAPFWDYLGMSQYGEQLARWYAAFGRQQIKVLFFDELRSDPVGVAVDLYRFLGVDDSFRPVARGALNAAGEPRSANLHSFLRGSSSVKAALRAVLPDSLLRRLRSEIDERNRQEAGAPPASVVAELAKIFRPDLRLAEQLIGRSLPPWKI